MKLRFAAALLAIAAMLCIVPSAKASGEQTQTITLQATMGNALTVSCTPTTVNFGTVPIISGFAAIAPTPIQCTFSWTVDGGTVVNWGIGFSSGTAMTGAAGTVSAANFKANVNSTSYQPCNANWNINGAPMPSLTQGDVCYSSGNIAGDAGSTENDSISLEFVEPSGLVPGALNGSIVVDLAYM